MSVIHTTREEWLTAAVGQLRPIFASNIDRLGDSFRVTFPFRPDRERYDAGIPDNLRVSCSNPTGGIRNRVMGECVSPTVSRDNHWEIWISPKAEDPVEVLTILVHELIHATVESWEPGAGHGKRFGRLARRLGLKSPLTSSVISTGVRGVVLRRTLATIIDALGDYPHASVDFTAYDLGRRRQTTRQLKVECLTDGCGFKVRMSRTWVANATPLCPVCEGLGVHSRTVVVYGAAEEFAAQPLARYVNANGEDVLYGICQLAGRSVHPDGSEDAEAVEQAAILRAERAERERLAREAAEEAARETARAARAAELANVTQNDRNDAGIDTSETGVVEGQGVQNRYGASEERRDRDAAERNARPVLTFEGVAPGLPTWIRLLEEAASNRSDMNDIEDACIRYCDRRGARRVSRFNLMEARRAMGAADARHDVHAPTETPGAPVAEPGRRSARFANLDFD